MRCGKCGSDNPTGKKFCGDCGAQLANCCPKCGVENPKGKKFCGECGAPLAAAGGAASNATVASGIGGAASSISVRTELALGETPEGERKTVTALFADIKGSMELMEDLDPEEARAIVDPALKLMIDAVHRYDGYIVQSTGDGIFALFGAPVAHEDHPQRALYAALRMQEELKHYAVQLRAEGNVPIEARIGANTGVVVVRSIATRSGHAEYTPIGHTTNLASRMQAVAPTGSIAVSEETRRLVEGYFTVEPLGPTRIKGMSEAVNVYAVTGFGPLRSRLQRSASRGYTKFVGRDAEMEALRRAAEQVKTGHGQIVAAVAEPGLGKSRLFYEFKVKNQSGWMVLEALSVSHGKASAYLPVVDLLHDYFDIKPEDDSRKRREKVNGRIITLDPTLEDTRAYLFGLLGLVEGDDSLAEMDAQIRRRRTQDAVKRILMRESLNQPLMLVFEDLHWVDEETDVLLNLLADSIGTSRVLLLVNYRPEYSHSWGSKTYYCQLRLDPLGKESGDAMLETLLGSDASLAPLKRLIAEKTEGNPLFMEEMYLSLLEDGTLARNGGVKLVKPLASLRIPPTVQGILAARIDRLPADEKDLLQTVAVIGTEFQLGVARAVSEKPDDELNRMLNDLQLAEFLYERPAAGAVEYIFKHALTHEVAYGSLLMERRRRLHERAGAAIESLFAGNLDDHVTELAHHFTQSGNPSKAAQYLMLAGKQALERSAFAESQAQLQKGLEWVKRVPDDLERSKLELELLLSSDETLRYVRGIGSPEVADVMRRADELCKEVGTDAQRFSVLIEMGDVLRSSGDWASALEKCQLALELAKRTHDPEMLLRATAFTGLTLYLAGRLTEGVEQSRRALEMARLIQGKHNLLSLRAEWVATSALANSLLLLGYPEQAEKAAGEALATARQAIHPSALVAAQAIVPVYLRLRMPKVARAFAEEGVAAAERSGFGFVSALWRGRLGSAIAHEGDPDKGLAMIRDALKEEAVRVVWHGTRLVIALIETLSIAGQCDEAVAEADALLASRGDLLGAWLADVYFLKGEAILGRGLSAAAQAEACFRKAIEVAKGQSARWWELRAALSLSRLLRDTGRRDEARQTLWEIYNWFTEGFDTADLKDANALLDELNA
jgi:class 3 adenylate cyclase/tetratricopeptide (TPR) repeat protein